MVYLWIALGLWLLPAVIFALALIAFIIDDKFKDKHYYRPMIWVVLSVLVALGALTVFILMNS